MTLPELLARLDRLGIEISARGDKLHFDAPKGMMTPEIKAALKAHKSSLLAILADVNDRADSGGLPADESTRTAAPVSDESHGEFRVFGRAPWRDEISHWPILWREAWGKLANAVEDETRDTDDPASCLEAEQVAHALLAGRFTPGGDPQVFLDAITSAQGWPLIVLSGCIGAGVEHEPLRYAEVAAAIDRAFADPKRAGRSARGPGITPAVGVAAPSTSTGNGIGTSQNDGVDCPTRGRHQ